MLAGGVGQWGEGRGTNHPVVPEDEDTITWSDMPIKVHAQALCCEVAVVWCIGDVVVVPDDLAPPPPPARADSQ